MRQQLKQSWTRNHFNQEQNNRSQLLMWWQRQHQCNLQKWQHQQIPSLKRLAPMGSNHLMT